MGRQRHPPTPTNTAHFQGAHAAAGRDAAEATHRYPHTHTDPRQGKDPKGEARKRDRGEHVRERGTTFSKTQEEFFLRGFSETDLNNKQKPCLLPPLLSSSPPPPSSPSLRYGRRLRCRT